jgi:hypothetical protein
MRELLFEAFFALVECCGHAAPFDFSFRTIRFKRPLLVLRDEHVGRDCQNRVHMKFISALHIASVPSRQHPAARLRRNYEVET